MAIYKHGTYGEFAPSVGQVALSGGTVAVYVGAAPVNLIRGYKDKVNNPIKLTSMSDVRANMGYSEEWAAFDLCEAFKLHFDNASGNIGPVVAINVLDPDKHKASAAVTKEVTFVNGRGIIDDDTAIIDTLVIADSVEGTDFTVEYDYARSAVVLTAIGDNLYGKTVSVTYNAVDPGAVTAEDIIGAATDAGVYTGLGCVNLIYPDLHLIPNLICCPKWSENPLVYDAMIVSGTKINGHWDAMVYADIPVLVDTEKVDSIALAKQWQTNNGYNNERSKVFWPQATDADGRVYHAAVLGSWLTLMVDASNSGIPMESPSNKAIPVAKQYFGAGSANRGFDQQQANTLNEVGITTVIYWGGAWVLWGPHTSAYQYGAVRDNRVIFDTSIRMMMYQSNSFQNEHAITIDAPMTRAMADTIRNREQEKADALAAVGAYIGTPVVEFIQSDNAVGDLVEGNFVWSFTGTPTPPFKSGTLKVAYTTAGFTSYFGEEE